MFRDGPAGAVQSRVIDADGVLREVSMVPEAGPVKEAKVDDNCIDCGACVDECPLEAIKME